VIGGHRQPGQQLHQVAGAGGGIELGLDQPVPGGGVGIKQAGQHEDHRAVGHSGQHPALQRAGADGFQREQVEQLPEAVDRLVEQGSDGLGGPVPAGEAGAAGADHHLHGRIGDPGAQRGPDAVAVVTHQCRSTRRWPAASRRCCRASPEVSSAMVWLFDTVSRAMARLTAAAV